MKFSDAEILSTYLDGQLAPADVARLESRLAVDADLRQLLDDLRVARGLLRRIRRRKAPRNFMLQPSDSRVRAPRPPAVPVLRYSGVLASLLFALTLGINGVGSLAARNLAAVPVPGYGMGGAGGAEPPQLQAAAPAGTPMSLQESAAPTAAPLAKTMPPADQSAPAQRGTGNLLISPVWILVLAAAAVVLTATSLYLDRYTRRNFRSRALER